MSCRGQDLLLLHSASCSLRFFAVSSEASGFAAENNSFINGGTRGVR